MNSTLNYNYYNDPSCCVKEALQEEFKRINLINMLGGELNPSEMHRALKSPQKGDVDSNGLISNMDLEQLIHYVGTNL